MLAGIDGILTTVALAGAAIPVNVRAAAMAATKSFFIC
jgi:hypothetical protein